MKHPSRLLLATVAGLSLAVAGIAQESTPETPKKDRPAADEAPAPKPEAKPRPQSPEAGPDRKKPEPPKADESKPRPRPEAAGRPGPDGDRPDLAKMREQMQARIQEIQKLREAGKHDEAEKLKEETQKRLGEMRGRFGDGFRGPGGPLAGGDGTGPRRGPQRPGAEGGPDQQKPEPPKADEPKPRPQPEVAKGPRGEGGDRPDMAKMREQMQARMQEVQKLREAGKHDEAEKRIAEFKKQAAELHARMGQQKDGGPRGPQRPGAEGGRDHKKPEPSKAAEAGKRPQPKAGHDRPDPAKVREMMQARIQEVQKLHQAGRHEEADRKRAEIRKHVGELRARLGRQGPEAGVGPRGPRAEGRKPGAHAGPDRKGPHGQAMKSKRHFQPRAAGRPAGPRAHFGKDRGDRGPGQFQGRAPQRQGHGWGPPRAGAPDRGRFAGPPAWGGRPGFGPFGGPGFHPGFRGR